MSITLYPDQVELVDATRNALRSHKSVLMQAATGSGKTVVLASIFESASHKRKRTMMVVPRQELLAQTSNTFRQFDIPHSFVSHGHKYDPRSSNFISTAPSLVNKLETAPDVDLLAVDETHYGSTALDKIIRHYRSKGAFVIGLSATPQKLSGKGLGCWYDTMVQGKSVRWLMDHKRLSEYQMFAPDTPDFSSLPVTAGDYNHKALAESMEDNTAIVGNVVEHYRQHAMGKINVTFSVSRKHSIILNQAFNDAGIPSAYVDGESSQEYRRHIFRALARREILNVVNCELLTFGFDLSSAAEMDVTVESISVARPTKSLALWMQILGRALRFKTEPAMIFDHSSNVMRLGFPDDDRTWTLADRKRISDKEAEAAVNVRQCPNCYRPHRTASSCPYCQYIYPVESREIEEVAGRLGEVKRGQLKQKKVDMGIVRAKSREDFEKLAVERGYKSPSVWAEIRIAAREGRKPDYAIAMSRRRLYA